MAGFQRRRNRRILMSVDAVGGVWRYAMDLATGLKDKHGTETVFVGFGPAPSKDKAKEAERIGKLVWMDAPLDWLANGPDELDDVPALIAALAYGEEVGLVHLNLPSQAAGLRLDMPIITVSHSCVVTWFEGVRGHAVPKDWLWQKRLNREGFDAADVVLAPSRSHAAMLEKAYGRIDNLSVVLNGSRFEGRNLKKEPEVFAAGRWWDDGKNGRVLDQAAALCDWPVTMAGAATGPNGQHLPITHARPLGELAHAETTALMERAAIVVSPSLYEPFGLAALEAARAGAALVLADIPTYRELWQDAALFADPHDPQAFAEAIDTLAHDEDLRLGLAETAFMRSQALTIEAQAAAISHMHDLLFAEPETMPAAE